jgi:hypothetical protein
VAIIVPRRVDWGGVGSQLLRYNEEDLRSTSPQAAVNCETARVRCQARDYACLENSKAVCESMTCRALLQSACQEAITLAGPSQ